MIDQNAVFSKRFIKLFLFFFFNWLFFSQIIKVMKIIWKDILNVFYFILFIQEIKNFISKLNFSSITTFPIHNMEALANQLDELHLQSDKAMQKALDSDGTFLFSSFNFSLNFFFLLEKIFCSCALYKFNRKNKRQERKIMVTNKAVYNLSKTSILFFGPVFH